MPSSKDYKAKAHNCLDIAEHQTTDAVTASLLRMLAADYFQLAEEAKTPVGQQQQQIQPQKPETDKNVGRLRAPQIAVNIARLSEQLKRDES